MKGRLERDGWVLDIIARTLRGFFKGSVILTLTISFWCLISTEVLAESENLSDQIQVVWPERDNGNLDIFFTRLTPSGWTEKAQLSQSPVTELMPTIASGRNGVSWVVWTADRGAKGSDLFYVYSQGEGWSDPVDIPTGLLFNTAPSLMIDEENRPWLVWSGSNGKGSDIFFSRWNGTEWETPSLVSQTDPSPDIMPLIGTDSQGAPWVCWFGFDGDQYRPYSSKWSSDGWSREIESRDDNFYKELAASGYRTAVPRLPDSVSSPEKAGVYVPWKGRLNSMPVRYLDLDDLLKESLPAGPKRKIDKEAAAGLILICFGDSITQGVPYINESGDGRRVGGYEPPLESLLIADSRPSQALNWGGGRGKNRRRGPEDRRYPS